ncbi:DUF433 domain-containing protein [Flavobacterium myungsuense]|uniref:DUF433 domain-containing protein n=1 Tax=Flavobacterium myungsuense TaxID=651823 RepID=A0ABW3J4S7_9FLAO
METSVLERITIKPDVCNGKPTVRGMRITVETILQYLSAGDTINSILEAYPFLEKEDIQACIAFALKNLSTTKNDIQLAS